MLNYPSHFRILAFLLFAVATGVSAEERPLRVVALQTVLTEIAREVGGAKAEVNGLVRPGIDPHTFDPSATDMRALADSDLILVSGLQLESYLDRLVAKNGAKGSVLIVGDALPLVLSLGHGHARTEDKVGRDLLAADGEKDPHWWHSIDNVLFATELVRAEFSRLRPAATEVFSRNAQRYQQRLFALKAWTAAEVAKLPPGSRHLVTSHDAFGYFARDYGFAVHPINGLSTESEANAKHLAQLIDLIRRERIKAVFAENNVNPRLISNLVSETGVRLGGSLFADGLGAEGTDGATYERMYRHNVGTIVKMLGSP